MGLVQPAKHGSHSGQWAPCALATDPVAIAGGIDMALDGQTSRVLVGLDGSEGSAAALHLTIKLARAIDAEITAMHVFQFPYPVLAPMAGGASMGVGGEVGSLEESTR